MCTCLSCNAVFHYSGEKGEFQLCKMKCSAENKQSCLVLVGGMYKVGRRCAGQDSLWGLHRVGQDGLSRTLCIVVPSEGKMPLGLSHHWCCCAQGPQLEVWEPSSCSQARDEHKYFTFINLPSWESER